MYFFLLMALLFTMLFCKNNFSLNKPSCPRSLLFCSQLALEREVNCCADVVSIRFFKNQVLQVLKKFAAFSSRGALADVGSIFGMS